MTSVSRVDHNDRCVFAVNTSSLHESGCLSIQIQNHTIALFYHNSRIYAVDNRCPHMGFPLSQGTVIVFLPAIGTTLALILIMEELLTNGLVMYALFL
jgi:hypothetical protein